jgi:hypothetical protein
VPHGSRIRATDRVEQACDGLVFAHATGEVTSEELSALSTTVSVDPPDLAEVEPAMRFAGMDVSFACRPVFGARVIPRLFDCDSAVVTIVLPVDESRGSAADVWADIQVSALVLPRGTTVPDVVQLATRQCDAPVSVEVDAEHWTVTGSSFALGPHVALQYHIKACGPAGPEQHATFACLRVTAPALKIKKLDTLLGDLARTVRFEWDV